MSRASRARHLRRPRWPAWLSLAAGFAPACVRADLWSLDSSVETRLETNDNFSLSVAPAGSVNTLTLSTRVVAARRVENAATRLNADLSALQQSGGGAGDRIDGRLSLSQTLDDPRNSVSLNGSIAQDFNSELVSADVTQGRGRRRTAALSASWSYSLTERFTTTAQATLTRAGYGQELTQATDYRNASVSASLNYRLSEVSTATLRLSHGRYRSISGSRRSNTDSIDAGISSAFSEAASASLQIGTYRTGTASLAARLACPLQVNLCEAGLVPYIVALETLATARSGLQFTTSARYQLDEVTALTFSAGREQAPSGAGSVVRSDTMSLRATRAASPTLDVSIDYSQSRSALQGGLGVAQPGQKSLALTLTQQLAPQLSLHAGFRRSLADRLAAAQSASANSFNVSLKYDWAKFEASR